MSRSSHRDDEPTREFPLYVGSAAVSAPTTAIPYTEPVVLVHPPRRRSGMLMVGLFAAGLIVLSVGVIAGYGLSQSGKPSTTGAVERPIAQSPAPPSPTVKVATPSQVTERFLTAALNGNEATMHEQLCALLRADGKKDNPTGVGLGLFVGFKLGQENINALGASVNVELTVPVLGPIKFEVYLVQESGQWRVCGGGPA